MLSAPVKEITQIPRCNEVILTWVYIVTGSVVKSTPEKQNKNDDITAMLRSSL
jgi:hypothetical protein